MYVCLCKAVIDKQIRKGAEQGCSMKWLINELRLAIQRAKYAQQFYSRHTD
jgi:bacterioferritin-associated ferredoxin